MDTDTSGFVYEWVNGVNGKWYLGSRHGATNSSYIGSGKVFKRAWHKYGSANFKRRIIYKGPNFRSCEEFLLRCGNAAKDRMSYNMHNWSTGSVSGAPSGMLGKTHSKSARERMSKAKTGKGNPFYGKTHTEQIRKKMSTLRTGRVQSEETIRKRVESRRGYRHSEGTIRKIRESNLGQKRSQLTRERIRATRLGARLTAETKAKISRASKSRRHTLESRQKMRESWKLRKMQIGKGS